MGRNRDPTRQNLLVIVVSLTLTNFIKKSVVNLASRSIIVDAEKKIYRGSFLFNKKHISQPSQSPVRGGGGGEWQMKSI